MIKQWLAQRKLASSLHPDPESRTHRFAQYDSKRATKAIAAILCVHDKALREKMDTERALARMEAKDRYEARRDSICGARA